MFKISLAGLIIEIDNRYPYVEDLCKDYIVDNEACDMRISVTPEEIQAELHSSTKENVFDGSCESICVYRKICHQLPAHDALVIHGAATSLDGEGYLFLAQSGTGKSTHIWLWRKVFGTRVMPINGDKPILRRMDGKWFACATPWSGKERWDSNAIVPLKAMCFLEQDERNVIERAGTGEVSRRIFRQLLLPQDEAEIDVFFTLLEDLVTSVPCYLLRCNREEDAVLTAYQGMQRE